jgi:hypothetical protein
MINPPTVLSHAIRADLGEVRVQWSRLSRPGAVAGRTAHRI